MVFHLFDLKLYESHLTTKSYGRPCIYLEKVESTIDVAESCQPNTIVLAREQTKGRGQRNNVWISPPGCAMASLKLAIKRLSPLSNRLCFLQHIMALAISETFEQIDKSKLGKDHVKLKWPNDIVYRTTETNDSYLKLGGILVHTKQSSEFYDITLSFGVNVFNKEPTICLKDILDSKHNLTIEKVVANTMNNLENITLNFDDNKLAELKQEYNERCIYINKLLEDELNGTILVKEVNDDGFLIGERVSDKQLCTISRII